MQLEMLGTTGTKKKGFSMVEILVAIAIFISSFSSVAFFAVDSLRYYERNLKEVKASLFIQEIVNAIIISKTDLWGEILDNSDGTAKRLDFVDNQYVISDGSKEVDGITLSTFIHVIYRDINGNILDENDPGAFEDYHSREIEVATEWINTLGQSEEYLFNFFVYDWNVLRTEETTTTEFSDGTFDLTTTQQIDDGEVVLDTVVYADWCNPSNTLTAYDLPGQGVAKTISSVEGISLMGTGQNASGLSLSRSTINDADPPVVVNQGTFDGYKTNDITTDGTYAYIGTDTNSKEVAIINTSTTPYTEVGYFDAPGSTDVDTLVVNGNYLYAVSNNTFYIIDVSSKSGSRPSLGSTTLTANGTEITFIGSYVFVGNSSGTTEVQIINVSNPAAPSVIGTVSLGSGKSVGGLALNSTGSTLYVGTEARTGPEVFVVNVTTKTGAHSAGATYETNGTSINGMIVVQNDERVVMVGSGGTEYQALNTSNPFAPAYCGGSNFDVGANDIATVQFAGSGSAYSYLLTNDSSAELKVIRGGPGGGGANGIGHASSGIYTSNVLDFGLSSIRYFYLEYEKTLPTNTDLRIQVRAGNTTSLSSVGWIGPDGTSNTYFNDEGPMLLPQSLYNNRYFQYKVEFISDTISTPILELIRIFYQEI